MRVTVLAVLLLIAAASFQASASRADTATDYLTDHFDNARLGWNPHETVLTVRNVGPQAFGLRFTIPVDGQVYAQPLYLHAVAIPQRGTRDVLLVATEHDTVYAFDAHSGETLWKTGVAGCCGAEPVDVSYVGVCHVAPEIGISSTPVVDRAGGTVYVLAKAMRRDGGTMTFHHTLHALALDTGQERRNPVEITGTTTLTNRGVFTFGPQWKHNLRRLLGNTLRFDPLVHYSRTGLLLRDGILYFGYGSHCHDAEAHGWVFAYRAVDLHQVASFVTVRDWQAENGGGVWQGGVGISADHDGALYLASGYGPFDANDGGANYADSALKLSPDLRVVDYFTPYTQAELAQNKGDFGGTGIVVLPDQPGPYPHLALAASKMRALFLLDRDHLGNYTPGGPDKVLQVIGDEHDRTDWCIGTCGSSAYYEGPTGRVIFNVWAQDALRAYRLVTSGQRPHLVPAGHSPNIFPGSGGATPTVSSNGNRPETGIVWVTTRPNINEVRTRPVQLFAYDATDLSHVLFSAPIGLWPNSKGHPFLTPTVVDASVYVGGYDRVWVFGLHRPPLASARKNAR
ncbi:MAG TPA: hypothetical protein VMA36_06110 [Candidatus Limnocylindria bacterium]|nr:hypothetical protein [Candidatus Limnocylindria bacterium]